MKIDAHVHILGKGKDLKKVYKEVYFDTNDNHYWFTRTLYNILENAEKEKVLRLSTL